MLLKSMKKSVLFIFSLGLINGLCSVQAFSSQSINRPVIKAWDFIRFADSVFTYSFSKNDRVIGTFHSRNLKKKKNWRRLGSDKIFNQVMVDKKAMMSLINISNWKVDNKTFKKKRGYYRLFMAGSYFDKDKKQTFFREVHLYYPKKVQQILVISPEKKFFKKQEFKDFIKGVQSFLKK